LGRTKILLHGSFHEVVFADSGDLLEEGACRIYCDNKIKFGIVLGETREKC